MTRQGYVAIATALREARQCWAEHDATDYPDNRNVFLGRSYCPEQEQWYEIVDTLAQVFARDNARFDRTRFDAAAGVNE